MDGGERQVVERGWVRAFDRHAQACEGEGEGGGGGGGADFVDAGEVQVLEGGEGGEGVSEGGDVRGGVEERGPLVDEQSGDGVSGARGGGGGVGRGVREGELRAVDGVDEGRQGDVREAQGEGAHARGDAPVPGG